MKSSRVATRRIKAFGAILLATGMLLWRRRHGLPFRIGHCGS